MAQIGRNWPKNFLALFWVLNIIFCKLRVSRYFTQKNADAFPSYGQKLILQGGFASQVFSNQKKGNFQGQILNVDIFSPIDGVTTILKWYKNTDKAFQKKKSFFVFLNKCKIYGDFCGYSHFFKNNSPKWGVRRVRNFRPMSKNFQKK